MTDPEAVSQNLMHSSLTVMDAIYSLRSTEGPEKRIAGLSDDEGAQADTDERLDTPSDNQKSTPVTAKSAHAGTG